MSAILLTSQAAITASGNSGALTGQHFEVIEAGIFVLTVSAASSVAGDKLDVYVQHSWDDGTSFDDFVHFAQQVGNVAPVTRLGFWVLYGGAPTTPEKAPQDAALSAGIQQGPIGGTWRVKWVVVNGGGSHTFSFSVSVNQWQSG